jgi:hypothetical protein
VMLACLQIAHMVGAFESVVRLNFLLLPYSNISLLLSKSNMKKIVTTMGMIAMGTKITVDRPTEMMGRTQTRTQKPMIRHILTPRRSQRSFLLLRRLLV